MVRACLRDLDDAELDRLMDYTAGQWSDGIGENFTAGSEDRCGFIIDCAPGILQGEKNEPVIEVERGPGRS